MTTDNKDPNKLLKIGATDLPYDHANIFSQRICHSIRLYIKSVDAHPIR